jgi:ribose-phosphate pyrophosphokinase
MRKHIYVSSRRERRVVLVATLDRPDAKLLPLAFAAKTARELGAESVALVAPYLAYMRQDRRFEPGEAVTSRIFSGLLSGVVDRLLTVDPHLHRLSDLSAIYSIPAQALHAAPAIARWIEDNVDSPLIVGPDEESVQWVTAAAGSRIPSLVLAKTRRGDRDIEVSVPDVAHFREHTPVVVDDIISTAQTMIETLSHLKRAGMRPGIAVGVHAVFAEGAYEALKAASARIVTTNTIAHETNAIDVAPLIADALNAM